MSGQATAATRGGVRLDWRYDGLLLVGEALSGPVSGAVTYRYDADFRVAEVAVNDAGVPYAYDDDGLLTQAGPVRLTRSATTGQLQTATSGAVATTYAYDSYGAPATVEARVSGAVVFREALTWDDIGRVTGKDVTVEGVTTRWAYGYDGASRLSEARRDGVVVGAWGYDGNGNRVTANGVTSTFDAQDRLLTAGPVTYAHDAFGNRTRKRQGAEETTYVYDGVGGLLSSTLPGGTRLEYHVDARGRRVGKRRNGVLEKGWLYDGQLRVVAETDSTGAVVSRFVYGTLSHSPDVLVRGGVTYRYVHDVLGSVRLVVNVATGQVAQRLDYDAWGVVTSDSSPGFQPFGFAGGLYDGDTKLTRFGARDYDAESGRWMSKDPIGFAGGLNLYSYSTGSPAGLVDPSGKNPVIVAVVAVGAAYAWLKFDSGNEAARLAREKTTGRGMSGDRNGMGDAMRPCIWSCEMSRDLGPGWSTAFGTSHELGGALRGFPTDEREMDLANNACGRAAAEDEKHTCYMACDIAYHDGRLRTLPNQGVRFVR